MTIYRATGYARACCAAALLFVATVASPAWATPAGCSSEHATRQWAPIERAIEKAESLGYSVDEFKRSKGCWKIEGYDRHGAEIELYLDGASVEVVKPARWRAPAGQK